MKFFSKAKDGGPESTVTGFWLVEFDPRTNEFSTLVNGRQVLRREWL